MQVAAADEGRSRGSPSTMEKGDLSAKKARVELPIGQVKQEVVVHEANGEAGDGAVVAAERASRVEVTVRMDMSVLHCPICFRPLKPPVFQCKAGHLACSRCLAELPGEQCRTCGHGGGFDRCPALDDVLSSARIKCSHDGCPSYVTYYEADDHQSACPHAPCTCTEPGCGFVGSPPGLVAHLVSVHSWPVRKIHYGKVLRFQVPVTEPRRLLVGEGDNHAFLLTVGALGAATVVSVVCIRASETPRPRYALKLWVNAPMATANRKSDSVLADMEVKSSPEPGAVAVEELSFLAVPPTYLIAAGASKELPLNIRIDKISS